jgi:hypothetical protein
MNIFRWFTNGDGSEWAMNSQTPMALMTKLSWNFDCGGGGGGR